MAWIDVVTKSIITALLRNTSHRIQSGIRTRDLSTSRRPLWHLGYRALVVLGLVFWQKFSRTHDNLETDVTCKIFVSDVTCVGHWPKILIDNNRITTNEIIPKTETSNLQNSTESTKLNNAPILPNTPTYLIVQERSGLARCIEFDRISGEDRMKLSVKIFEAECFEQVWMSQAVLTYQGACQEALTDVTSISGASKSSNFYVKNYCLFYSIIFTVWLICQQWIIHNNNQTEKGDFGLNTFQHMQVNY